MIYTGFVRRAITCLVIKIGENIYLFRMPGNNLSSDKMGKSILGF